MFNYREPSCADDIKSHTRNSLGFVLDCISEPETMQFCYACIGRAGGKYTALEPYPEFLHTRKITVVPDWVLGPTILGKRLGWPEPFAREPSEELRAFGIEWFAIVQLLLDQGKLKPHPLRLVGDGFDNIFHGLKQLEMKTVSGEKLVCRIKNSANHNLDRILAEETTEAGEKKYLVSYATPELTRSQWVRTEDLIEKPGVLLDWYKEKWWNT